MIAALFSRSVSQVLIALITCVTTLGGTYLAFKLHQTGEKVEQIRVYVNGRLDEVVAKVERLTAPKE